jgi:hypothetical protein
MYWKQIKKKYFAGITIEEILYFRRKSCVNWQKESTGIFVEIENTLRRALQIVQEQHALSNVRWAKSIGVRKMVNNIDKYEYRITNPKTWKGHNIL